MSDWQSEGMPQEPETNRVRWARQLVDAMERIEEKYIMASIDRDTYYAELSDINDRLSIIGLTLMVKPWQNKTPRV